MSTRTKEEHAVMKVAIALCIANGHNPDTTYDVWVFDDPDAIFTWAGYRKQARAAIKTVKELQKSGELE